MSKASTDNYNAAIHKYNQLTQQYMGEDAIKKNYDTASEIAAKNSTKVQQDKYNSYLSQGMNPAKAAKLASQDASNQYTQDKNELVNTLYNANKDVVNAQNQNIENAKTKDDVSNQNKGRILSTVGGVASGVASALSDENAKEISAEDNKEIEDFDYYIESLR